MITEQDHSSEIQGQATQSSPPQGAQQPARFQAQLSDAWRLRPAAFGVTLLFCGLFLLLNYLPLRGTDLWLHVNLGDWILEQQSLPTNDPFMALAEGMPMLDSAWLSQVLFALAEQSGGAHLLSALFAATLFLAYVLLATTYYRQTHSALIVLCLTTLSLVVGWSRLATIRPENFAFLLFCGLLLVAFANSSSERLPARASPQGPMRLQWILLPLLLLLWANLHGSFVMGLVVVGCLCLGQWLAASLSLGSLSKPWQHREMRSWLWLSQLCLLATLVNPHGIDLWLETVSFGARENLRSVLEWQPLTLLGVGGREYAASIALLLIVLRWSRARMTPTQVLLLTAFAAAPILGTRMLTWYAPVLGVVLAPHLADCFSQIKQAWQRSTVAADEPPAETDQATPTGVLAWKYSLLALLAIWTAFALSPWSHSLLGTSLREPAQLYEPESTPLLLTQYLNQNPPQGQTFHPQAWGDWLLRRGPAEMQVFATSNIHVVPTQVWQDYNRIAHFAPGWQASLDRYDVTTWIADKQAQPSMKAILRQSETWQLAYEDDQSLVYVRQ